MAVFGLPGGPELIIIAMVLLVLGIPAVVVAVVVSLMSSHRRAAANAVPPGWLPDPSGRHQQRYWNGTEWTVHVADGGVQSQDAL